MQGAAVKVTLMSEIVTTFLASLSKILLTIRILNKIGELFYLCFINQLYKVTYHFRSLTALN